MPQIQAKVQKKKQLKCEKTYVSLLDFELSAEESWLPKYDRNRS